MGGVRLGLPDTLPYTQEEVGGQVRDNAGEGGRARTEVGVLLP